MKGPPDRSVAMITQFPNYSAVCLVIVVVMPNVCADGMQHVVVLLRYTHSPTNIGQLRQVVSGRNVNFTCTQRQCRRVCNMWRGLRGTIQSKSLATSIVVDRCTW